MQPLIETLEVRALFSATAVATDAQKLVADLTTTRAALQTAVTTYHSDAATLTADVNALPKSKTNTVDIANIKKAQATALAIESKDVSKLLAAVQGKVKQGVTDTLAYAAKPTTSNALKLGKLISATQTLATPYVTKLSTDLGASGTKINAALQKLAADNPGQTTLATHVQQAEADEATTSTVIQGDVAVVSQDLSTLAIDLQSGTTGG